MNDSTKEETNKSRRKFVKVTVATAYVAPLIASMPAKALVATNGSGNPLTMGFNPNDPP